MGEGLKIEIFRKKDADDFTLSLADPDSRMETGSAAAMAAALSAAFLHRAAAISKTMHPDKERVEYLLRNTEIIRNYMVHLIDEDVKARGPLRRALKEGGEREIEAARHPAAAICSEIINMMSQSISLAEELTAFCPGEAMHYVGEGVEMATAAMKCARLYTVDMSDHCSDDTYRYIVRRENEITLERYTRTAETILCAVEKAI